MNPTIDHSIKFDKPAILLRADTIAQFGEGYRQISGTTIAKGSVIELLEKALAAEPYEQTKLFISNEHGTPRSIDEVQAQARADGISVRGG